jgi:hypothetical protein
MSRSLRYGTAIHSVLIKLRDFHRSLKARKPVTREIPTEILHSPASEWWPQEAAGMYILRAPRTATGNEHNENVSEN